MSDPKPPASLGRAYFRVTYLLVLASLALGVAAILLINLATPLNFFREMTGGTGRWLAGSALIGSRRFMSALASLSLVACLGFWALTRPLGRCLTLLRDGVEVPAELLAQARRQVLNLPIYAALNNLVVWLAMPGAAVVFMVQVGSLTPQAALALASRAAMIGLISTSMGFFIIERHARRRLIPLFFPEGRLSQVQGAVRLSIGRRIQLLYAAGTLVPLTILVVTLLTIQGDIPDSVHSAEELGQAILSFVLVVMGIFVLVGLRLNRLVSASILEPLENMLAMVAQVQAGDYSVRLKVVSNDELGRLGEAGNAMIRGLAERERVRSAFGRYLTPEIRDEILSGRIPLAGERRVATVMFADLRDFTLFVESHPPEEVLAQLKDYFTAMHLAIRAEGGLVLQFVGDQIEAVFGVPLPYPDHAVRAARAALAMRAALARLNDRRTAAGQPPLAHGVGIHTGPVLAGNSGSADQSAYSLIGTTVNLASRLQDLTKEVGHDLLLSGETAAALSGGLELAEVGPRPLRGYSRPVTVFRLLGPARGGKPTRPGES